MTRNKHQARLTRARRAAVAELVDRHRPEFDRLVAAFLRRDDHIERLKSHG